MNLDDPKSLATYEATVEWERANLDELERTIACAVERFPDRTIVIRPHPAEDPSYWTPRFDMYNNIVVVKDSSHVPWTLGADVVIHTSCSTGTEAAVLGVPALSITPRPNSHQQNYLLSNSVNAVVESWQEAAAALTAFFEHEGGPITLVSNHEDRLADAYEGYGQGHSAARIANDIVSCLERAGGTGTPDFSWSPLQDHPWVKVDRRPE